jgi:hypothetical protein
MIAKHRLLMLSGLVLAGAATASLAAAQTDPAPAAPAAQPAAPPADQAAPAPAPAGQPADQTPAASTSTLVEVAAVDPTTGAIAPPSAGKAQIVFFRPFAPGFLLHFSVWENGKNITRLDSGNYQPINVNPGAHDYLIRSEARDILHIEVDAGEVYYVKQTMSMGMFVGHPHLQLSDQATFEKAKSHLHVSTYVARPDKVDDDSAQPAKSPH